MALHIDESTVRHVAHLARLHVTADELKQFTSQLGAILDYIEQLNELDIGDVPPTAHAGATANVFREDVIGELWSPELALANAPDKQGTFFKVPKVLDLECA
jgi:aspartyl-tRNA(Asn)/glutamyl-tRNA(Gln) amidotransferase subunit C